MIIPPGFAAFNVRIKHAAVSRPAYITGGVRIDTPPVTNVAVVLGGIYAGSGSDFCELMDFDCTVGPVTAYVGQDGGSPLVFVDTRTRLGGVSITAPPGNCAVLIHKRSTRGGRRGRGRWFVPWTVGEANVDEAGAITASTVTQLQGEYTSLLAAHNTVGLPLVLLHDESEPTAAHPSPPGLPNEVVQLVVDPLISTQRRRLGR